MFQKLNFLFKFVLFSLIAIGSVFFAFKNSEFVSAETYKCDTPEEKAACSRLLSQTEKEINALNEELTSTKAEGASLKRDKAILDLQIKQSKLKIKAHELTIANIGKDIVVKTKTIATLDSKIEAGKESLAQIIRKTREFDSVSLPEFFLGTEDLSKSFADLDSFIAVTDSLNSKFTELKESIKANEVAKINLSKKRDKVVDTKAEAVAQKKKIEKNEAEKAQLIALNNATQSGYQKVLADKAAQAAQIKAALFKLRDAGAITFEDALRYAQVASKATGVRAALILGILKQESNLGVNVGQCLLTDTKTGEGKGKNTGTVFANVMKPMNLPGRKGDVDDFLAITSRLGKEWSETPVSCPIAGVGGYGGAMGPSQFIPTTWAVYGKRIESILGISVASPWVAEHAFTATSLFMADLGAGKGGYSAEREAAARYYAGGNWAKLGIGYASSVLAHAAAYQTSIDFLEGN